MGTLTQRIGRAVADKGLSIGDAWSLLSEALDRAKGSPQGPVSVRAMLARLRQDMGKDGGEAAEGAG